MSCLIKFEDFQRAVFGAHQALPPKKQETVKAIAPVPKIPETLENITFLKQMLAKMDPDPKEHGNRVQWRNTVWGIRDLGWACGYDIALEYSERGDLFNQTDFDGVWWSELKEKRKIGYRSIFFIAKQQGYQGPSEFPTQTNKKESDSNGHPEGLVLTTADQILAERVDWLVEDCFPLGMIGVIGGNPGLGKSQIAIKLAALATSGIGSPLQNGFSPKGSVIILANEDDAARTIRPRLEAAGAILNKVHIVQGVAKEGTEVEPFQLDQDVAALRACTERLGDVRLIIIDPPNAYIGGKTDTYKDSDVRKMLAPLQSLAHDTGALILLVVHLNKRSDGGAHQRFNGTGAWVAVSRVAYLVGEDEVDHSRHMLPVKNNLGNDKYGFIYDIREKILHNGQDEIKTSHIVWVDKSFRSANELLSPAKKTQTKAVDEAKNFLEEELSGGTKPVNDIKDAAKNAGISWSAIRRAKDDMFITVKKGSEAWEWTLTQTSNDTNLGGKNV
jgi:putative DNA primase/helicase